MRVLPGTPNGISLGTGLEHDEVGRPSENRAMRTAQSDKRLRKVRSVVDTFESPLYEDAPYPQSDLLIIGMAGTRAVISEVADELREKRPARQSCPDSAVIALPGLRSQPLSAGSEKNRRRRAQCHGTAGTADKNECTALSGAAFYLKYNGDIFYKEELLAKCKEVL